MFKRLTAILLLLALGAGVASGAPLHTGGMECEMEESMQMMDCCKRARSVGNTPEVQAARLCCAVNCQNGGANAPSSAARVSSPPQASPLHPSTAPAPAPLPVPHEPGRVPPAQANESPPVYLLNLTFLI